MIANQNFYYKEYGDTRASLEAAGLKVKVGAGEVRRSLPHRGTGEGADGGAVTPDVALPAAKAEDYSAIAFVGGWGASSYQPAFPGVYAEAPYNGSPEVKQAVNRLINEFLAQGKPVGGLCHGVSVLAWARVQGKSPLAGREVVAYAHGGPACRVMGRVFNDNQLPTRWSIETNGGVMAPSRSIGNPGTSADDVWVHGPFVTGEDYDSAALFGRVLARETLKPADE